MFSQNNEEKKLDWMYKGPGGSVDREEYLLGRSIDKSLEQLNATEKGQSLMKPPKNHVEHECIPPSIRDFKRQQLGEQVDLAQKLQEDPLIAIKKREEEARQKLLQNPVQLKKIQKVLKSKSPKKKKKSKKKHSKKSAPDSSDDDRDRILSEKYTEMKDNLSFATTEDDELDKLLIEKFMKLKHLLKKADLDEILRDESSSSEDEMGKKSKNKYDSSSDSDIKTRKKFKQPNKPKYDSSSSEQEQHNRKPKQINARQSHPNYSVRKLINSQQYDRSYENSNENKNRLDPSSESQSDKYKKFKENTFRREYDDREKYKLVSVDDRRPNYRNSRSRSPEKNFNKPSGSTRKFSPRDDKKRNEYFENKRQTNRGMSPRNERYRNKYDENERQTNRSLSPRNERYRKKYDENEIQKNHRTSPKSRQKYKYKNEERNLSISSKEKKRNRNKSPEEERRFYDSSPEIGSNRKISDEDVKKDKRSYKKETKTSQHYSKSKETSDDSDSSLGRNRKNYMYDSDDYDEKLKRKRNFGLVKADGTKIYQDKNKPKQRESINKAETVEDKRKPEKYQRKKLTEEEKEQRRNEMMQNAAWRDNERERNVKKYRVEEKRESKQQDYNPEFINRELLKSANNSTLESRIKSNLNNIQRSSRDMSSHFSRRH